MIREITNNSRIDKPSLTLGMGLLICGLAFLFINYSVKHSLLLIIGFGLGVSLYHAAFGFTGSWRKFILERKGSGIRSQLLAIGLAILLIHPFLGSESLFGSNIIGALGPIGVSVIIGSFLFGLGMQLGGGCGSGTLFTAGGGNARMLITLIFFIFISISWLLQITRLFSLSNELQKI